MHHSFQLASALDVGGVVKVMDTLRVLPGVQGVNAMSGVSRVDINFDEDQTSPQELSAVLARAGYPEQKKHGGHTCCGGCGGQAQT